MQRTLLFIFSAVWLISSAVASEEIYLRDNLMKASPGDFIVTAQNRAYTLLLIVGKEGSTLAIEEVSVPLSRFPEQTRSWREWIEQGAPGHTSWVGYEIEPESGQMLEYYSYTQNGWSELTDSDNLLGKLLGLRLERVSSLQRRRVGALPREGEVDKRAFWQPQMVIDGQKIQGVAFDAWKTRWPRDGSELAGKSIEVYLPQQGTPYPSYFPAWLQISGAIGKAKVRIIDSGTGLRSPKPPFPRRPPFFLNNGLFEPEGLRLWLRTRTYSTDYALFAVDGRRDRVSVPIPLEYSLQKTERRNVFLFEVPRHILEERLEPNKSYRFIIRSRRQPQVVAETADPIRWSPNGAKNTK